MHEASTLICVTRYCPPCEVDMANDHAAAILRGQSLNAKSEARSSGLGSGP